MCKSSSLKLSFSGLGELKTELLSSNYNWKAFLPANFSPQRRRGVLKREGEGGNHRTPSQVYTSLSNFPKCPLRRSLAQANLFAILTVSSVSVIDLSQYIGRQLLRRSCFMVFLTSPWDVGGQKMYALKSPMPQEMSNTNRFCLVYWKNPAVDWLLERRQALFQKSLTTCYFAKRDPDETICEKFMRLNIFAKPILCCASDIFGTETWRGGLCPPKFSFWGEALPLPAPPPLALKL